MNKNLQNKLKNLNVTIVSHVFATGPALELEEYLKGNTKTLQFIGLPFSFRKELKPFTRYYVGKKLAISSSFFWVKTPDILFYLRDIFVVFYWIYRNPNKIDLYIGSDNFSAYLGTILKRLGKVNQVVLYTIDYLPNRFSNPLLNNIYHFFDKQCLKYCKIIWNVSPVMAKAREEFEGLKQSDYAKQLVVPLGVWYKRIPKLPFEKRNRYQLVFMGHLLEKQGLDIVIQSLNQIVEKIPQANLVIIGTGEYEDHLKKLAIELELRDKITFTGYIERHEDIEHELARSALAIAMYKPDPNSFTNWSDPGKLKNYLAAGLPIVLTSVPPVAKELEDKKCAVICEYNSHDFAQKVIKLLSDTTTLKSYSNNASSFARQFDWNNIFSDALETTLK